MLVPFQRVNVLRDSLSTCLSSLFLSLSLLSLLLLSHTWPKPKPSTRLSAIASFYKIALVQSLVQPCNETVTTPQKSGDKSRSALISPPFCLWMQEKQAKLINSPSLTGMAAQIEIGHCTFSLSPYHHLTCYTSIDNLRSGVDTINLLMYEGL